MFGSFFRAKHIRITRSYDRRDITVSSIPAGLIRAAISDLPRVPPIESPQVRTIRVPNLGGVRVFFAWIPDATSVQGKWQFVRAERAKLDDFSARAPFEPVDTRAASSRESGDE